MATSQSEFKRGKEDAQLGYDANPPKDKDLVEYYMAGYTLIQFRQRNA